MKQNYRHIDRNLLLGLWVLIKANQAGKSVIRLENTFLRKWWPELTIVSPSKANELVEDLKHILPFSSYHSDWHNLRILDLCAHKFPESYHREIYPVKDVPTEEQMEDALGIQWKCIMVTDYNRRTESSPYI